MKTKIKIWLNWQWIRLQTWYCAKTGQVKLYNQLFPVYTGGKRTVKLRRVGFQDGIKFCKGDWTALSICKHFRMNNMPMHELDYRSGVLEGIEAYTRSMKGGV